MNSKNKHLTALWSDNEVNEIRDFFRSLYQRLLDGKPLSTLKRPELTTLRKRVVEETIIVLGLPDTIQVRLSLYCMLSAKEFGGRRNRNQPELLKMIPAQTQPPTISKDPVSRSQYWQPFEKGKSASLTEAAFRTGYFGPHIYNAVLLGMTAANSSYALKEMEKIGWTKKEIKNGKEHCGWTVTAPQPPTPKPVPPVESTPVIPAPAQGQRLYTLEDMADLFKRFVQSADNTAFTR